MCSPTLAVAGVGVALSSGMQVYSGMQQAAAHEARADQYELQKFETRTRSMQQSRQRFSEFTELEAANNAAIAASGLSSESFDATMKANRRTALEDASLIEAQGRSEEARLKYAAEQEEAAAGGAIFGAAVGALGTIAQGAASIYGQLPQGSPSNSLSPSQRSANNAATAPRFSPTPRSRGSLFNP